MTKACIIGISGYGETHYELLLGAHDAGKVEIVGAAIINPDEETDKCRRLRELGCRIFGDYREMLGELSGTAEFCMIPTGTPLHRPMTVVALEAGMHVLVEKPAAGCIEDVRLMQEAARKAVRVVAVGYQHMYSPAAMATKRHILEGTIGSLKSIQCLVMWPRDNAYYSRNDWAGKLNLGETCVNDSPFNNAVAHELMMMLFQAGLAERSAAKPVSVKAELYRANAIESADTASIHIETAEGVPIRFYATHASQETLNPEIHIRGTRGSIVMTHGGSVITPDEGDPMILDTGGVDASRQEMMTSVLDAVEGGSSYVCDLETASRQTTVVSAIHSKCTIHPVEGETATPKSDPARTFIPGIEEAMRRAFDAEQLLSEVGFLTGR